MNPITRKSMSKLVMQPSFRAVGQTHAKFRSRGTRVRILNFFIFFFLYVGSQSPDTRERAQAERTSTISGVFCGSRQRSSHHLLGWLQQIPPNKIRRSYHTNPLRHLQILKQESLQDKGSLLHQTTNRNSGMGVRNTKQRLLQN